MCHQNDNAVRLLCQATQTINKAAHILRTILVDRLTGDAGQVLCQGIEDEHRRTVIVSEKHRQDAQQLRAFHRVTNIKSAMHRAEVFDLSEASRFTLRLIALVEVANGFAVEVDNRAFSNAQVTERHATRHAIRNSHSCKRLSAM